MPALNNEERAGPPHGNRPNTSTLTNNLNADHAPRGGRSNSSTASTRNTRSKAPVVVAELVADAEPGKVTSTAVVLHDLCGRRHVHRFRGTGDELLRRPQCGLVRRYLVLLPGSEARIPEPRVELRAVGA